MATATDNIVMDAWKRQLDTALRVTEAIIEGSTRMHEVQIEAGPDVVPRYHARVDESTAPLLRTTSL